MKKIMCVISFALATAFILGTATAHSQFGRSGYGYGTWLRANVISSPWGGLSLPTPTWWKDGEPVRH